MAVKIRLARIGKKHHPFYRLVASDSRQKRDGAFLDNIGTYDAVHSKVVRFEEELYNKWVAQGAQVTPSAQKIHRLFKKEGIAVQPQSPSIDVQ
ncbi:MAG TPA: 30S ribosomal protein S16 [Candidatus Babeliales bacterium]|jgi:small subunit ribosomal protein S16|nr:30S ribosomal protein S16 [Candidatus Babeliales bacterium]